MDFDEYRGRYETAEKLAGAGDDRAALKVLVELGDSDLPDLDRAQVWASAAAAHERLGDAGAALAAFDRAAALEEPHRRFQALFRKADYLLRLGRQDECRDLFRSLLSRPDATLAERSSIESRLKLLRRVSR